MISVGQIPENLSITEVFELELEGLPGALVGRRALYTELIWDAEGGFQQDWEAGSSVEGAGPYTFALRRRSFSAKGLSLFTVGGITGTGGGSSSVSAMSGLAALPGSDVLRVVEVLGFYSPGDGGGGSFYWVAGGVAAAVPGMVVNATGGQWRRRYDAPIHSRWFGTKGDGTTDDIAALDAFYAAVPAGGDGYLDAGVYRITQPWTMARPQTTIRAPSNLFDTGGAQIKWDGAATDTCAIRMISFAQVLEGVSIVANSELLGGILVGNTAISPLQTHNTVRNCGVLASSEVGSVVIGYGYMVGADPTQSGNGQDFNVFENCGATNVEFAGYYIGQSGNTINTKLVRCFAANYNGTVGQRKYVSAGLVDGVNHPYGVGVWMDRCNSVIISDFNGSYVETVYKITGVPPVYVQIDGTDSEHSKKLITASVPDLKLPVRICGGRIVSAVWSLASLGPDGAGASYDETGGVAGAGFLAADNFVVDVQGINLSLESVAMTVGDNNVTRIDNCIRASSQSSIQAVGCLFPSFTPFTEASANPITSWGNYGSAGILGAPTRCVDGVYRINAGGHVMVPVHFDSVQTYTSPFMIAHPAELISGNAPTQMVPRANNTGVSTVTGAAASTLVSLPIGETDALYQVVITPVEFTGAPLAASYVAFALSKTTTDFLLTPTAPPGVGASVTFRWEIMSGTGL